MPRRLIPWECNKARIVARTSLPAILLLIFFLFLPSIVHADWSEDYQSALKLLDKNDVDGAIPKLLNAISEKPIEDARAKTYGLKFIAYFPHYYLGLAYFATGDYQSALKEFEISLKQGAIRKDKDRFRRLADHEKLARAQISQSPQNPEPEIVIPQPPPPTQESESPPATAQTAAAPPSGPTPEQEAIEYAKKLAKNGARKYFQGDYDGAIRQLLAALYRNPQDAAAQFLLGCCYASKYLLSGSEDKEMFNRATLAFKKSRAINPQYQVKEDSYISPAVLQIYQQTS